MIDICRSHGGLIDTRMIDAAETHVPSAVIETVKSVVFVLISALILFLLTKVMKNKGFKFNKTLAISLGVIYTALLVILGRGVGMFAIKGTFLLAVLIYASCSDLTHHEVDDCVWVMILALALVDHSSLFSMIIGAVVIFVLMMITALVSKKTIGGADIKISTALVFLLGFERGIAAIFMGLLSAVIIILIYHARHREKRGEPFALVPFLSIGALFFILC